MNKSVLIAAGGALGTAVAFGPARMGYGLFLPYFRDAFALSTAQAGVIASSAFAGFLVALVMAAYAVTRLGPRLPVVIGALAATVGTALVASAQDTTMLASGTILAATSAGLCWTPFNNAAGRAIATGLQGRVLSIVSTGTTAGIAGAGLGALAVATLDWNWRAVWFGFSALALSAAALNVGVLRRLPETPVSNFDPAALRRLLHRAIWPLYLIAVSFGTTNGIYLSFAVDHVDNAGGLAGLPAGGSGAVLFIAFGVGGIAGLITADVERRLGLRRLVQLIFLCSAASLALLAIGADTWLGVTGSAALQGLCLMGLSAIFSFVSQRLYPDLPSASFTAVLAVYALGNVFGPVLAGTIAGLSSLIVVFWAASAVSLFTSVCFRPRLVP